MLFVASFLTSAHRQVALLNKNLKPGSSRIHPSLSRLTLSLALRGRT
jgi:hypothetical protein